MTDWCVVGDVDIVVDIIEQGSREVAAGAGRGLEIAIRGGTNSFIIDLAIGNKLEDKSCTCKSGEGDLIDMDTCFFVQNIWYGIDCESKIVESFVEIILSDWTVSSISAEKYQKRLVRDRCAKRVERRWSQIRGK